MKIRLENTPLWTRHPEVDVAALRLNLADSQSVAAVNWDQIAPRSAQGSTLRSAGEVWILCYPAQLESSSAGFPIIRWG